MERSGGAGLGYCGSLRVAPPGGGDCKWAVPPKEAPLSSHWLPSRTWTEGTASGPHPPAVGRGHGGRRTASPTPFKCLGAEGALRGPAVSPARGSQNVRPGSRGGAEGTGKANPRGGPRRRGCLLFVRLQRTPGTARGAGSASQSGDGGGRELLQRVSEHSRVWGQRRAGS